MKIYHQNPCGSDAQVRSSPPPCCIPVPCCPISTPTPPVPIGASVFGGMYNHPGYPVVLDTPFESVPLLFDGQSPSTQEIAFQPGRINMEEPSYSFTPGTLLIGQSGLYAIYYCITAYSSMDAEFRTEIWQDGSFLLNSMVIKRMQPGYQYDFSRMTYANLPAGTRLQAAVYASEPGLFQIGGNLSELLVNRLGNMVPLQGTI